MSALFAIIICFEGKLVLSLTRCQPPSPPRPLPGFGISTMRPILPTTHQRKEEVITPYMLGLNCLKASVIWFIYRWLHLPLWWLLWLWAKGSVGTVFLSCCPKNKTIIISLFLLSRNKCLFKKDMSYYCDIHAIKYENQGCALSKIEGSPALWTCKIQGAQHMICMKNLRFSSCPRAKVRHQGPTLKTNYSSAYELKKVGLLWTLDSHIYQVESTVEPLLWDTSS